METQTIIKTEIQGIEAKFLLSLFENLNNRLNELQKAVIPQPDTALLTRKEVAKMLDISLPTLHNWVKNGTIQAYRIGNKVRFKKSEVLQALQSINPTPAK